MSDRVVQSCRGDGRRAVQSMHSYQSVWMAHWTRTSCREAPHVHNHLSLHIERNADSDPNKCHLLGGLEMGSDTSTSTKGFTEVEARTVRIMNEDTTISSKGLINEKSDCQPFPMFNLRHNISGGVDSKDGIHISRHKQVARRQIDCNIEYDAHKTVSNFQSVLAVALSATEILSRECQFQWGVSQNPQRPANTSIVIGDSSLALAGPCQENITGSTQIMPYRFNKGKTPVLSFKTRQAKSNQLSSVLAGKEHVSNTNSTSVENENNNYDWGSAFLVCEKKLKNEPSVETDAMDMDNFNVHNNLSGKNSIPSNKSSPGTSSVQNILLGQNLPFQATITSGGEEVECGWAVTRFPEEIPTFPAAACSKDNAEPGNSRTQSLEDDPPRLEPGSRWLKRLRLSDSDLAGKGTRYLNMGEPSSKLYSKIMKTSKSSSSEPMFREGHDKEEMDAAQTAILLHKGKSSSLCSAKKDRDILLSHSWLQRWCHNRAVSQQKKPEVVVVCEPLMSSKGKFDEQLQTKKFPSIAAMALMGKALRRFQPCEFRRRGSFLVWNNTEGF